MWSQNLTVIACNIHIYTDYFKRPGFVGLRVFSTYAFPKSILDETFCCRSLTSSWRKKPQDNRLSIIICFFFINH